MEEHCCHISAPIPAIEIGCEQVNYSLVCRYATSNMLICKLSIMYVSMCLMQYNKFYVNS